MLNTNTISNTELISLWLHGKSANTVDGYRRYAERFFISVGNKPLKDVTLMDFQLWEVSLKSSDNSKRVAVGAIKSLFSFAKELGVISSNLGILVKSPTAKNRLAERILTEEEVKSVIGKATNPRDRVIIRLLYYAGLRVSELCALKWRRPQRPQGWWGSNYGVWQR